MHLFFKVASFIINRESLINYHRTLNDLFEEELMQNEKISTIIFSSLRTIYTMAYTYFAILVVMMFAYYKSSCICMIHNFLHFHSSTNCTPPISGGFGLFSIDSDNFLSTFVLRARPNDTQQHNNMRCR